jgi:hypothetical protein
MQTRPGPSCRPAGAQGAIGIRPDALVLTAHHTERHHQSPTTTYAPYFPRYCAQPSSFNAPATSKTGIRDFSQRIAALS